MTKLNYITTNKFIFLRMKKLVKKYVMTRATLKKFTSYLRGGRYLGRCEPIAGLSSFYISLNFMKMSGSGLFVLDYWSR